MRKDVKEEQFRLFFEKFLNFFEKNNAKDFSEAVAQHEIQTSMEQLGSRVASIENDLCNLSVETAKAKENYSSIANQIKSLKNIIKISAFSLIGCLVTVTGFLIKIILFP